MRIVDCYKNLMRAKLISAVKLFNEGEDIITDLEYNSRSVKKGALFFCKGENFKREYLLDAVDKGAVCYVSEHVIMGDNAHKISAIIVNDIRKAMSLLSKEFYLPTENKINIVGITGTKGKSTTTYMLKSIMNEYLNDKGGDCAYISGIEIYDGVSHKKAELTTPETIDLYKHINNAVNSNREMIIIETSSQALKYGRCEGITFDEAVLLNISNDHISEREHPTYEDYVNSKLKIFDSCRKAWINSEIKEYKEIIDYAKDKCEIKTFGSNDDDTVRLLDLNEHHDFLEMTIEIDNAKHKINVPMGGDFNSLNALAAISLAYDYGVPMEYIEKGLMNSFVPGRMEIFESDDKKIVAIIDYAHNGASFEKIFRHISRNYPDRKIAVTFGCVGGKAYNRRKETGEVSSKYANNIYIVPNNPGEESYNKIGKEIVSHMEPGPRVVEILNSREEGIREAFRYAHNTDDKWVILILGKSRDEFQIIGEKKVKCRTNYEIVKEMIENA
jgi:UDP-N-acetylmuramoyl-L-alanyl-D-glutamate--2,6-diaminopimelate ligase